MTPDQHQRNETIISVPDINNKGLPTGNPLLFGLMPVRRGTVSPEVVGKSYAEGSAFSGKVAVAGCSFGGYHAANFAFRHPGYVSHIFSMGGAFNIKNFENLVNKLILKNSNQTCW